ncbi:MAG: hypothetical protein VXW87_03350 [Pseudomonadota bacterium]|nr:hypothetical protein [Pseudomonadota bacterium]
MTQLLHSKLVMQTVSAVVACMDMISVVAFAFPFIAAALNHYKNAAGLTYKIMPLLKIIGWSTGLLSVFILSFYATYRNTNKIYDLPSELSTSDNALSFFTTAIFSFLLAVSSYVSHKFSFLVLFPRKTLYIRCTNILLPLIYSVYTLLNKMIDLNRATHSFSKTKVDKSIGLASFFKRNLKDQLLIITLAIATVITCHYKLIRTSISLASTANQYGGAYYFLEKAKRLFFFPILAIGFYNVGRCTATIKKILINRRQAFNRRDYAITIAIALGAYTHAVSSKVLSIAPQNFAWFLFIDKASNSIRQCEKIYTPVAKRDSKT